MPQRDLIKIIFVLFLLLTFPSFALADVGSEGFKQEIDGYQVELVFAAGQAHLGSNELAIKLHNAHGQPLNDAVVKVSIVRPDPTLQAEPPVEAHDPDPMDHAAEANAAGHSEEVNAGDHAMMADVVHSDEIEEPAHQETVPSEASPDDHIAASADISHEAEGEGHHGEAENMVAQLIAAPAAGHYQGHVDFTDTGAWLVKVNFVADGEAKEANFIVEAARNASTWWIISGFGGLNALVIVVAAVLKRNPVETRKGKG